MTSNINNSQSADKRGAKIEIKNESEKYKKMMTLEIKENHKSKLSKSSSKYN